MAVDCSPELHFRLAVPVLDRRHNTRRYAGSGAVAVRLGVPAIMTSDNNNG